MDSLKTSGIALTDGDGPSQQRDVLAVFESALTSAAYRFVSEAQRS